VRRAIGEATEQRESDVASASAAGTAASAAVRTAAMRWTTEAELAAVATTATTAEVSFV